MMLRLAIGIILLTSSAHAAALTSVAVADPLVVGEAQDARAGSPAAPAIWANSAALRPCAPELLATWTPGGAQSNVPSGPTMFIWTVTVCAESDWLRTVFLTRIVEVSDETSGVVTNVPQ